MTLTIGSLFSGYGGLDMACEQFFGATTAWVSDIDSGACKILAHRFPDAPNLGDITTVDWAAVEPVDIIAGGSPCQDLSTAGRRAGMTDGTRSNLWVQMREAIAHVRPRYVIWENVRGAYSARAASAMESDPRLLGDHPAGEPALRALGRVLGDLAELGYDASWCGLRAADVGAPHGRFRVFILAWDASRFGVEGVRAEGVEVSSTPTGSGLPFSPSRGAGGGLTLLPTPRGSDANGSGVHGSGGLDLRTAIDLLPTPRATRGGSSTETVQLLPTPSVADAMGGHERRGGARGGELLLKGIAKHEIGPAQDWGKYAAAIARWEAIHGPAPAPTEPSRNGSPRLSGRFTEWMMGVPAGWITDVPNITRNEALKACGNGVVPAQAIAALQHMAAHWNREAAA